MADPICLSIELADTPEPPNEFRLFAAGRIESTKGVFIFDEQAAKAVMSAASDWGNDFPVDYGHAMLGFIQVDPAESGKAAGWFRPEVRNGELWAASVQWTPPAAEKLRNREYRYVSPAFRADKDGRILELANCALTNIPATKRAPPIVAHRGEAQEQPHMKNLLAKLGLSENAAEVDAIAALDKLTAFVGEVVALSGKSDHAEAMAVLSGLKAQAEKATELTAQLAKIEAERKQAEIASMLDAASKDLRLTPAKRAELTADTAPAFARDPSSLKVFLDMLPPPPPAPREPEAKPSAGKKWEQMSHVEKADLFVSDKALYDHLKAEAESAG